MFIPGAVAVKHKILVAYATKFGSTKEVAEKIGKLIQEQKIPVDVRKVNTVKQKPVACFSVGLFMKEDIPENREKALKCMNPVLERIKNPVSIGLFGGKIDYSTMPVLLR